MENNYIDKVHEIESYESLNLENVALQTKDKQRLIRLSPFINVMLKFPFLRPLFRLLSFFPTPNFGRLYDGYLEMRFMDIPAWTGFKYYLRIREGIKAFQDLK